MGTILIRNGYILDPIEDAGSLDDLRRADILIRDDSIVAIGSFSGDTTDSVIDASGRLVIPGLISSHTHISTNLDRALVDNCPLDPWMTYTVHAAMPVTAREMYVATALGAVELLETGTTCIFDHTPFNPMDYDNAIDAVAQALVDVGLRAVVSPLMVDLPFSKTLPLHILEDLEGVEHVDIRPACEAPVWLEGSRRFLERWHDRHSRIKCSLGLSGPQRSTPQLMEGVSDLARSWGVTVQTHVYETKSQWIAAQRMFPGGMLNYMNEIGLMGSHVSFAHSVWLGDEDIELIARTGTKVAHNPVSNLRIGSGVAPVQKMRDMGISVGIGTDGPGSGDSLNMFEVMKFGALIHKLYGLREDWVAAAQVFEMCLQGGAAIVQQPVGTLKPGHKADISILKMERLFNMPREHTVRQLVYSELGSSVDTVLVDGRVVVDSGRVVTVDVAALRHEAQEIISRMYADLPRREALFRKADGFLGRMLAKVDAYEIPQKRQVRMA